MQAFLSDFYFKGERKYIMFPTVFETFKKAVTEIHDDVYRQLFIKHFKIHKDIINNSLIKVFDISEFAGVKHKQKLIAEMLGSIGEKNYVIGLYEEDQSPVTKRVRAIEKELVGPVHLKGRFSGTCDRIKFKDNYELIQACCETNKQLHLLTLPQSDKPYEIKSVLMVDYKCPYEVPSHNAHLKINNLSLYENPSHHFTFNQLELNLNDYKTSFQLCYSRKKQ